jgi:membrane fusion protein, multidrug efflux system
MKSKIHVFLWAIAIFQLACNREKKEQKAVALGADVVSVKLAKVETSERSEPIRVSGTIASLEEARLSFKIGGIISRVFVTEGQAVRKGQLLAILDQTEIDAQVNQAKYAVEKSARDLLRVKNMLRDTAATLEQFQNASTGFDVSQQNLDIASFNQAYSRIISPLDGVIIKKMINEGELTGPGTPALIVSSRRANDWVIRAGVSDRDWARIRIGDKADIKLDAYPDEPVSGKVSNIAQAGDPVSKLYEIEIKVLPDGKRMASGLYGKVEVYPSQTRSYTIVPVEAVVEGNGNNGFVFVHDQGKARRIPVSIGYVDGEKVLISGGLENVSEVITSGSGFLRDNAAVQVKN